MNEGARAAGVVHGGVQDAELSALGLGRAELLDLSASLNPLGPHPSVLRAAAIADVRHYPEPDAASLREAVATSSGLDGSQVLVTPGATAALHLAARALLRDGDACLLFPPTFGEYTAAVRAANGRIVEHRCEPPGFTLDVEALDVAPVPLAMLCNPDNPTGRYLPRHAVEALAARLGGVLVLDVAYDPFVEDAWDADDLVRADAPVLVVHSMTKLHAVPGLRLGYVTGARALVERLRVLQPSWAVDAPAIAAGLAALRVDSTQRGAAGAVARTRAALATTLRAAGVEVVEGRANFLLARVHDAPAFRHRLLARGVAVRDCSSFGLPQWVRIAVPREADLSRLVSAFLDTLADRTAGAA